MLKPTCLILPFALLGLTTLAGCGKNAADLMPIKMPLSEHGKLPLLLSETGAFKDLKTLTPSDGVVPYTVNLPFWSDGAGKGRWMALPTGGKIGFAATGEWSFPTGSVFVKHFAIALDERDPAHTRRLETRLLVVGEGGKLYGVTYKWRPDESDADLMTSGELETLTIQTASGPRTQTWRYPTPTDCRLCHTPLAGKVLGVNTRQINCDMTDPATGRTENQLVAWNRAHRFAPALADADLPGLPKLAASTDSSRSLEDRARSWIDANCANCHRPSGVPGLFDARYDTPLAQQNLIDGPVTIDLGIDRVRAIAPGDPERSMVLNRILTLKKITMPPVAHHVVDTEAVELLTAWIRSLPAPTAPATQPAS